MAKRLPAGICDDCEGPIVGRAATAETCFVCKAERKKQSDAKYRKANPEVIERNQRKWRESNREHVNQYQRDRRAAKTAA